MPHYSVAGVKGESELSFDNDVQSGYINIEDIGDDIVEVGVTCGSSDSEYCKSLEIKHIPKSEMIAFLEDALSKLKGEKK